MKKKFRMLIAAAIALVLCIAAYFIVINVIPEPEAEVKEKLPTYYLTNIKTTDFDRIDIELADGYKYAIIATTASNANGSSVRTYMIEDKAQYAFDRDTIGSALVSMCQISVSSILDENPTDLSVYGLKNPISRVTITPYEGDPVTVLVGDQTPVGSNYYAMVEGKPEVYMIGSYVAKYMINTEKQYREMGFINFTEPASEIRSVMVTENDEPLIGVRVMTQEEIEAIDMTSVSTQLLAPVEHTGNDSMILQEFLPKIKTISAISIVEDGTENAEKYGLTENTTVVEIEGVDGSKKKVTLSQPDASGYRYGIIAGINSILLFNSSDFDFIYTDYTRLMYKLVWIHNIENVERVEMDLKGEKHTLDMEFYIDPNEPVEEGEEPEKHLNATLDGKEISETNGRRLFIRILSPLIYDMADESEKRGDIEYSLTVYYADGQEYTMDFARLNERQYVAIRDGEDTGFYVNVKDLTTIADAIVQIESGFELSL